MQDILGLNYLTLRPCRLRTARDWERRNVILKVAEGTFDHLSAMLRAGDLDLVVGRLARSADLADTEEELLFSDAPCIVAREGLRPPVPKIESVSFLTNRWLQLNTDMISIWPRSVLDADGEGLIALSAEHGFERSQVGLYRRRNALLSPAAQAMVEALHAASAPHGALPSAEGG
jgi:DNA-binding transcriptional LysR family regulator